LAGGRKPLLAEAAKGPYAEGRSDRAKASFVPVRWSAGAAFEEIQRGEGASEGLGMPVQQEEAPRIKQALIKRITRGTTSVLLKASRTVTS